MSEMHTFTLTRGYSLKIGYNGMRKDCIGWIAIYAYILTGPDSNIIFESQDYVPPIYMTNLNHIALELLPSLTLTRDTAFEAFNEAQMELFSRDDLDIITEEWLDAILNAR